MTKINTSCKKCIFATYQGNKQIGCFADRLDKFADKTPMVDFDIDGAKEYYRINGRICNLCHQQNWADHVIEKFNIENPSKELLLSFAQIEVYPKVDFIIIVNQTTNYDSFLRTIRYICSNEINSLWFYQDEMTFDFEQLKNILHTEVPEFNSKWFFHIGNIKNLYQQLNNYICFVNDPHISMCDYMIDELDYKINNNLEQCLFIQQKNWTLIHSNLLKLLPAKFTITENDTPIETFSRDDLITQEKDFTKFNEYVQRYIELHSNNT